MASSSQRLLALDVFRGITIAGMVLVNDAGDWGHVYEPLEHAPWNGLTPTDLIFPFFLFIVGVAMTLSFAKRRENGESTSALFRHTLIRSSAIFAIGVFLYAIPAFDVHSFRIMGVLQRIAVASLLGAAIFLTGSRRAIQWWTAGILLFYWAAMTLIPVPGIGAGVLTPEGNLSGFIDRIFLSGHMWYLTRTWDPEGLFSTLPAVGTVLLGILAGFELRKERPLSETVNVYFVWGTAAVIGGLVMNPFFPINKSLWTSSYVLVTAGLALIGLASSLYIIEIKQKRGWISPFLVFGKNAIAAYVFASLFSTFLYEVSVPVGEGRMSLQEIIYKNLFGWIANPFNASVAFAACFVLVTWLFAWVLYRKNIFLKI